jgi:glycosyltransferase involved in cell wall biosynthesis
MNIGFLLHYRPDEAAWMALCLADHLWSHGDNDVQMVSMMAPVNYPADSEWANRVHAYRPLEDLRIQLGRPQHLFSTVALPLEQITSLRQNGTACHFLCCWDELDRNDIFRLNAFNTVLCPSRASYQWLSQYINSDLRLIHWDTGDPFIRDWPDETASKQQVQVALYWPLDGDQSRRQDLSILPLLTQFLHKEPHYYLSVSYPRDLPAAELHRLQKLYGLAAGRVDLYSEPTALRRRYLANHSDLVLWPTRTEGAGLTGLMALAASTPVVAYDHPVVGELIRDDKNGRLAACELHIDDLGVPRVEPNPEGFLDILSRALRDRSRWPTWRFNTNSQLFERRTQFRLAIAELLRS